MYGGDGEIRMLTNWAKMTLGVVLWMAVCGTAFGDWQSTPALASGLRIRPENHFFEVSPRIVRADQEAMVEVKPLFDHCRPKADCTYELTYVPVEQKAERSGGGAKAKTPVTPKDGGFQFRMFFEGEQEHVLYIEEIQGDKRRVVGDIRLYSLNDDLFALRPYKGDFHMHSNRSDGVESPAYVAGACRRVGLDFMALSDHKKYAGSQEAMAAYRNVAVDLKIYPGEEVHAPDNPVHILSFGAKSGITELYKDETQYRAEVAVLQSKLPPLLPGVNAFQYASCLWVFDRIRERGGLGMFNHAYRQLKSGVRSQNESKLRSERLSPAG